MDDYGHDTCIENARGVVTCGDGSKSHTITPIEGFYYANDPDLPYPTCVLRVSDNDVIDKDLTDYAFISNLAYMPPNNMEAQKQLNLWYGNDTAIVNDTLIQEFRNNFPFEELGLVRDSPVSFKLIQPFPITVEALDTYTFNVVPKGDPVPMLDDKANLYQNINCTAGANDLLGCHAVVRTICETMYRCGTKFSVMDKFRPVLCECVLQYEYPEPIPLSPNGTTTSFRQQCIDRYPNKWNRSPA